MNRYKNPKIIFDSENQDSNYLEIKEKFEKIGEIPIIIFAASDSGKEITQSIKGVWSLSEILSPCMDGNIKIYSDGVNVLGEEKHDNGKNFYTFRELRIDRFCMNDVKELERLNVEITSSMMHHYTTSLQPIIKNIFNW